MGQGRIRGTTLHYTFVLSVTETSAFSTRPKPFDPVLPGEFVLCPIPAFTIRRLSAMALMRLFPVPHNQLS